MFDYFAHFAPLQAVSECIRKLYCADNLPVLRDMQDTCADLIYLDPPFNSQRTYSVALQDTKIQAPAFTDVWIWGAQEEAYLREISALDIKSIEIVKSLIKALGKVQLSAYLVNMVVRIVEMHRVLKPTGSLYLHCDPTASHYLKIVLDTIFGAHNFRNEIVWWYRKFGQGRKNFKKNHDVILYYCKDYEKVTFNPLYEGFSPKTQKDKYKRVLVDSKWKQDKNVLMADIRRKDGVAMGNTWEISFINSQSKERIGYPTQKPVKLLERIIQASSNEGDLVLDPFCGSGTTVEVAENLHRQWIGVDSNNSAIRAVQERFLRGKNTEVWDKIELLEGTKSR